MTKPLLPCLISFFKLSGTVHVQYVVHYLSCPQDKTKIYFLMLICCEIPERLFINIQEGKAGLTELVVSLISIRTRLLRPFLLPVLQL